MREVPTTELAKKAELVADGDGDEVTLIEQHQRWSNSQYWKFLQIFGDDKERKAGFRNPTLALKAVIDFCR